MKPAYLLFLCAAAALVLPSCKNFDGPIHVNPTLNSDSMSDALPEEEMSEPQIIRH